MTTTTTTQDSSFYTPAGYVASETHQRELEMRQGRGSKMYTLWVIHYGMSRSTEVFIKNLSIDKDKAWTKAKAYADQVLSTLGDDSKDELRVIVREADVAKGMINFGKNNGKYVTEIEDGYLLWICQGAKITVNVEVTNYYNHVVGTEDQERLLACPILIDLAKEEAIKRGWYQEYDGKMMPVKLIEAIKKSQEGFDHYFEEKEKVELVLTVVRTTSYEGSYGWTYIYTFADENGRKFIYKGSRKDLEKDQVVTVKGTVKHSEYKGQNQTFLQRIKIA